MIFHPNNLAFGSSLESRKNADTRELASPQGGSVALSLSLGTSATNQLLSSRPSLVAGAVSPWLVKRLIDLSGALLLLVMFSPLMLLLAIVLKFQGGPVLFRQERVGLRGERFRCLKFRSMVVDADRALLDHLRTCTQARREWEENHKLAKDPRVTKFGHFLRTTSLDELPQLINVLRGQMSLVGPRPIVPQEMARYGDRLGHYLTVRPGLTGLWQVSGRSNCTYAERVALDARYVSEWRLTRDLMILLQTVPAVMARRGSC